MIKLSDANPIQFWLNGSLTYNESFANFDPAVINEYLYVHRYIYSKESRTRFVAAPDGNYRLRIFDENDIQLEELVFTETEINDDNSAYEIVFQPATLNTAILNEKVYCQIVSLTAGEQSTPVLTNPEFTDELDPWANGPEAGQAWEWVDDEAHLIAASPPTETQFADYDFNTNLDGWDNELGLNPYVWAWNASHGGSAKVTTVNDATVNNLRLLSSTVPQQTFKVRIKFLFATQNSATLSLRLVARDAGNNNLFVYDFGTSAILGIEQTADIEISNSNVWLNFNKWIIALNSSNFNNGDDVFITNFEILTQGAPTTTSKILVDSTSLSDILSAGTYRVSLKLRSLEGAPDVRYQIAINNSGNNQQVILDDYLSQFQSPKTHTLDIIVNNPFNTIYIRIDSNNVGVPVPDVYVDFLKLELVNIIDIPTLEAYTDFIMFTDKPFQYQEILYKSSKNFAQMYYTEESPYFNIAIPGVFFHERDLTQQKAIELSNSKIIGTGSELKKQKLFTIDDIPDYLHTKILLILQHSVSGSVKMNGVEWTVEEAYDKGEPEEVYSYPLKPASIYLTRKGYTQRNAN